MESARFRRAQSLNRGVITGNVAASIYTAMRRIAKHARVIVEVRGAYVQSRYEENIANARHCSVITRECRDGVKAYRNDGYAAVKLRPRTFLTSTRHRAPKKTADGYVKKYGIVTQTSEMSVVVHMLVKKRT